MSIDFTPWPEEFARRYREKGYWLGEPLTAILRGQSRRRPNGTMIICGDRRLSYAQVDAWSTALAGNLARRGVQAGDTALVQFPNVAEFYVVFFALLKMGVVPVNALFSHSRLELTSYAQQIAPRLLMAFADHPLFADGAFTEDLKQAVPSLGTVVIHGTTSHAEALQPLFDPPAGALPELQSSPAGHVAFFQLSGAVRAARS